MSTDVCPVQRLATVITSNRFTYDSFGRQHTGEGMPFPRCPDAMSSNDVNPTRRQFVLSAAALAAWHRQLAQAPAAEPKKRPRLAAIYTVFHQRAHAHV